MTGFTYNEKIAALQPSASVALMAKANQMIAEGMDIINLAGGEPDFPTPSPIVEEAVKYMRDGYTHYTSGLGLPELRERIAVKLAQENDIIVSKDDILVTPGGKFAIYLAITALLNPGDEAMFLDPAWVSYVPIISACGGVPVPVVLDSKKDFHFTAAELERYVTDRTRLLIINYPCNPTGKVLGPTDAAELEKFMIAHPDILLLSDEIYERIVYDGYTTVSPASFPSIKDRVITVNGFSKSVAMTGWRLGYLAAPAPIYKVIYKLFQHCATCVSGFIQKAAVVALDCTDDIEMMRRSYQDRRDAFIGALNEIDGVTAELPEGAFYAWIKVEKGDMTDAQLCEYLLQEAHVAGVPGSAYGKGGTQYIRYSYATAYDDLMEAAKRIKTALDRI